MTGTPQIETETRRVVLLRRKNFEIWLRADAGLYALPELEISRSQRIAEQLANGIVESIGVTAVSISALKEQAAASATGIRYQIMESCASDRELFEVNHWVPLDSLERWAFRDENDFSAVREAVAKCTEGQNQGPFGNLGWFDELWHWVQQSIEPHGLHLRGPFRQLNGSPEFSLICFETNGSPVWFKATGAPNRHELHLTLTLSRFFTRSLPQIIGTRREWNGWLALNAEGMPLDRVSKSNAWKAVAGDLADLQIASFGRSLHLLKAGARDLGSAALKERVEPFFQTIARLMERQSKVPPAVLSRLELQNLSKRVLEALIALDESDFPTALGHLDFNPGNIICSPEGTVFLDWAEAFVGHPFLTFEYHLQHFRRTFGIGHADEAQVVNRYSCRWRDLVSETAIARALENTPLVAVFAYATANEPWNKPPEIEKPGTAAYLRGLTRRMYREARLLANQRHACPH